MEVLVAGYESACSPGANALAVWYRASILGVLQLLPGNPLMPWSHAGELDDAVFKVAATFPMKKLPVGLVKDGLPFDVQELVKQIGAQQLTIINGINNVRVFNVAFSSIPTAIPIFFDTNTPN